MSSAVRKDKSHAKGKSQSSDGPKRKRERPKTKQKKGLYAFGKTSLRVSRDIYFNQTEETEARANEDLHKIIDLANCDRKSAKHADRHVTEEATVMSKTANRNLSREEVSSREYFGHKSKISVSVTSESTSNSSKKRKGTSSPNELCLRVTASDRLTHSDRQTDDISPMLDQVLQQACETSPWTLPSHVLEDATKELLTTVTIKLRDLRRNKDGTYADLYYGRIRHDLQRIHRQRLKNNIISKHVPNESPCETPSKHAVHPRDAMDKPESDFQLRIRSPEYRPLRQSDDCRVKIPGSFSRPFSTVFSDHANVEDASLPVADFTKNCGNCNSLPEAAPFMSCNSRRAKQRQLYAPKQMQPIFSQQLQDSAEVDILDYADTPVYSSSFPVQEIQSGIPQYQSSNDNAIWQSLPVISPIKLPPFSNPSPRFYRRKLY